MALQNVCICIGFAHLILTQTEFLLHQIADATTFLQGTRRLIVGFFYLSAETTTCGIQTLPYGGMIVCLYRYLSHEITFLFKTDSKLAEHCLISLVGH